MLGAEPGRQGGEALCSRGYTRKWGLGECGQLRPESGRASLPWPWSQADRGQVAGGPSVCLCLWGSYLLAGRLVSAEGPRLRWT